MKKEEGLLLQQAFFVLQDYFRRSISDD